MQWKVSKFCFQRIKESQKMRWYEWKDLLSGQLSPRAVSLETLVPSLKLLLAGENSKMYIVHSHIFTGLWHWLRWGQAGTCSGCLREGRRDLLSRAAGRPDCLLHSSLYFTLASSEIEKIHLLTFSSLLGVERALLSGIWTAGKTNSLNLQQNRNQIWMSVMSNQRKKEKVYHC